jgi:hypothetical protein
MSISRNLDRRQDRRRESCPAADQRREPMPDFILLLHSPAAARPALSPEQISTVTQDYMGWRNRMRAEGHLKGGEKLTFDAGRVMRANGGRVAVTDGPYAESKELLGGFFLVTARDYDEACHVAESCPHFKYGGSIEVRQIDVV